MPDYKNGRIYRIVSPSLPDKVYIGSCSHKWLSQRWANHLCDYRHNRNYTSAWELLDMGDAKLELIENFPCNTKDELRDRENYWMDTIPNVINKRRAKTTHEELKERQRMRQYERYTTDPAYREHKRQYYRDNREACLERTKRSIAKRKLREEYSRKLSSL